MEGEDVLYCYFRVKKMEFAENAIIYLFRCYSSKKTSLYFYTKFMKNTILIQIKFSYYHSQFIHEHIALINIKMRQELTSPAEV